MFDLFPDEPKHDPRCATGCEHVNLPPQLSCPVHAKDHDCTCEALAGMDAQAVQWCWVDFWHDQARDWEKVLKEQETP